MTAVIFVNECEAFRIRTVDNRFSLYRMTAPKDCRLVLVPIEQEQAVPRPARIVPAAIFKPATTLIEIEEAAEWLA
jgi:hypothetical protein